MIIITLYSIVYFKRENKLVFYNGSIFLFNIKNNISRATSVAKKYSSHQDPPEPEPIEICRGIVLEDMMKEEFLEKVFSQYVPDNFLKEHLDIILEQLNKELVNKGVVIYPISSNSLPCSQKSL